MSPRPARPRTAGDPGWADRACDPPEWRRPYADQRDCWGCGLEPDVVVNDLHYGNGYRGWRPFCRTCWDLIEPAMRRLPRPPIGMGGYPQPIIVKPSASALTAWARNRWPLWVPSCEPQPFPEPPNPQVEP